MSPTLDAAIADCCRRGGWAADCVQRELASP